MSHAYTANEAAPADDCEPVTPSDTDDLSLGRCRALFVGGAGDVHVLNKRGFVVPFPNVQAGSILPVRTKRVLTDTTATSIVALY